MQASRAALALSDTSPLQTGGDRTPVVEILSADKVFPNGTRALAPIDLTITDGEFLTLIGPSGCGKSTLLKLIANLIEPSDGRILWWSRRLRQGRDGGSLACLRIPGPDADAVGAGRGQCAPAARSRAASRRPRAARGSRMRSPASASRASRAHYPRQLSGGMKMRVSIARSLVTAPNLLLMDEPFGALDEFTRNRLDADLVRLWWERKLTTIFVTHSIYEAVFLSTRVVVMGARPGRVFKIMPIDEPHPRDESFRNSPHFAEYCRALSASLTEVSLAQVQR